MKPEDIKLSEIRKDTEGQTLYDPTHMRYTK